MRELKDLLNQIRNFHCQSDKDKVDFIGTLVNKDNHVIIQARIEKKNLDCMEQKIPFQIWGEISETNVTLLDNDIITTSHYNHSDYIEIASDPSEIVIGRSYNGDLFVTNISASIAANNMFSDRVFNENVCFTKENPTVLSFAYPEDIEAIDTDGTLRLYEDFLMTGQGMVLSIGTFHILTIHFQNQPRSEMLLQKLLVREIYYRFLLIISTICFLMNKQIMLKIFLDIVIVNYV